MSKNLKFFLISFLLSAFFWGGFNALVINFSGKKGGNKTVPQSFSAQVLPEPAPVIEKARPEINAKAAFAIRVDRNGQEKVVFEKNPDDMLAVASLTKLMTAWVALEYYDPSQQTAMSKEAVNEVEDFGQLKVGETLSVENLLYIMLIESSNDAARALSEMIGDEGFVNLMNIEAKNLGMASTNFMEAFGLNPKNHSTARDFANFSKNILKEKPEIWAITRNTEYNLYDPNGIFHHKLLSTDQLLKEFPQIIGGKTGFTLEAKGCLVIVSKDEKSQNTFINVLLGSDDRFGDMRKIIEYEL